MKVIVTKLYGDASLTFFNKSGEIIHQEAFSGKLSGRNGPSDGYIRPLTVSSCEFSHEVALFTDTFEYVIDSRD